MFGDGFRSLSLSSSKIRGHTMPITTTTTTTNCL